MRPEASTSQPFVYGVDPDAGLAYARMWGRVTGADMRRAAAAVHADPAWHNGFDAVWDCSSVTGHVVDIGDVQPLVDEAVASGAGQDALIESPSLGDSAISKLLAAFFRSRGKDAGVYPTVEAALAALGRDALPPTLDALRA